MTATTASDPSGVEYRFTNVTLGTSSPWQDSPAFTATGLTPATTYTFTVMARDKSPAQNTTAASDPAAATTDTPDTTPPSVVTLNPANGSTTIGIGWTTQTTNTNHHRGRSERRPGRSRDPGHFHPHLRQGHGLRQP
jgi:hypothetical protein